MAVAGGLRRLLREPLLHFLAIGGLFFAGYYCISGNAADRPRYITVSRGQIENMAAIFARTWQRPPNEEELQGLIKTHIRDEILFREGQALGLDRDDSVIRNRVRVKMEALAEDAATPPDPGDAVLQAWLERNAKAFAMPSRYTLVQVYFDPKRRGPRLDADLARALTLLGRRGGETVPSDMGDTTMLPERIDDMPAADIAKIFGAEFAAALASLPLSAWQGPVRSTYGAHLVRVTARSEVRARPLAEVRDAVLREWTVGRRKEASEKLYDDLLKRYTVEIEAPAAVPGKGTGQ